MKVYDGQKRSRQIFAKREEQTTAQFGGKMPHTNDNASQVFGRQLNEVYTERHKKESFAGIDSMLSLYQKIPDAKNVASSQISQEIISKHEENILVGYSLI